MNALPNFIISNEVLEAIEKQIISGQEYGFGSFEQYIEQANFCLDIEGKATYSNLTRFDETEADEFVFSVNEITLTLWSDIHESPQMVEFSDDFEKNIFDQINSVSE